MSELILIDRALCLPASDIAALLDGRLVTAMPKISVQRGWTFALYSCGLLDDSLTVEEQYRSSAISLAQNALANRQLGKIQMQAWAKCESCTILYDAEFLERLSQLTVWTKDLLQAVLQQRGHIFLAYLQVYQLPQPISVSTDVVSSDKFGKFVGLSALGIPEQIAIPLRVTQSMPILDENVFQKRKKQVEELKAPLYLELEELQDRIDSSFGNSNFAKEISSEIRNLLGWRVQEKEQLNSDLEWIQTIADVGNSSNGNEFEKLVRRSLILLGFSNSRRDPKASLDPNSSGGAGGLDVYCDHPYSLVGECKASENENVPNSVSAQLIHLGNTHLGRRLFDKSVKIIFASGPLTGAAKEAAIGNEINVMRPETLQELVELKSKYPGSINLLELKDCLERVPFGEEAEKKLHQYIQQVRQRLKVRSHIIQAIKRLGETELDRKQFEVVEIRALYNAMFLNQGGNSLDNGTVHEILIELSSPLAGYVGRVQGTSLQTDRFYYLRDLIVE